MPSLTENSLVSSGNISPFSMYPHKLLIYEAGQLEKSVQKKAPSNFVRILMFIELLQPCFTCSVLHYQQNKNIQLQLILLAESSKHRPFLSVHTSMIFHYSSFLFLGPSLCQRLSKGSVDLVMTYFNTIILGEKLSKLHNNLAAQKTSNRWSLNLSCIRKTC